MFRVKLGRETAWSSPQRGIILRKPKNLRRVVALALALLVGTPTVLTVTAAPAAAYCATGTDCTEEMLNRDLEDALAVINAADPIDVALGAAQIAQALTACGITAATGLSLAAVDCVVGGAAAVRDKVQLALLNVMYATNALQANATARGVQWIFDMVNLLIRDVNNLGCFISNPIECPPSVVPATLLLEVDTASKHFELLVTASTNLPVVVTVSQRLQESDKYAGDPGYYRVHMHFHEDPEHCGDPEEPFMSGLDVDLVIEKDAPTQYSATGGSADPAPLTSCFA